MLLVDTNVIIDIATRDDRWFKWSTAQIERASLAGPMLINDVIFSEIATRYDTLEHAEDLITRMELKLAPMSRTALFSAAKAFRRYRAAGGVRTGVLPDFFIGAHAEAAGIPLLTRDPRRYRTYFPTVELIAPEPSM